MIEGVPVGGGSVLSGSMSHCSERCVLFEWRKIHTLLRHSLTFVPPPLTLEEEFLVYKSLRGA